MLSFLKVHSTVWRLVLSLLFHAGIPQAYLKPQAKCWRYQAAPHWHPAGQHWQDAIEDALVLFARSKALSFPKTLVQVMALNPHQCQAHMQWERKQRPVLYVPATL